MPDFQQLQVAVVTDSMASPGGSDRLLQSILKILPQAHIYTSVYFPNNYDDRMPYKQEVRTSFMQRIPGIQRLYRHLNFLMPFAFEQFDFNGYDLLISLSAGASKGIIPQPEQTHIGVILTPPRSLWSKEGNYRGVRLSFVYKFLAPFIATYLRVWDQSAIKRVDHLVAISQFIQEHVRRVYQRESDVIYPGVSDFWFEDTSGSVSELDMYIPDNYFLVVSRLYDYKRIDWAIDAARAAEKSLVIVGEGPDRSYLQKLSDSNIYFLGWESDQNVRILYKYADALLFCGIEDYGYVPVEAMATGCPVIAYRKGGVTETVQEGVSGEFFESKSELAELLRSFRSEKYDRNLVREHAQKFNEKQFFEEFKKYLKEHYEI